MTLPWNLQLWLVGNDGVEKDANGWVSAWNDKSSNAYKFTPPNGNPRIGTTGHLLLANGRPATYVKFNSDGPWLTCDTINLPGQVTDQSGTYDVAYELWALVAMPSYPGGGTVHGSACVISLATNEGGQPSELLLYPVENYANPDKYYVNGHSPSAGGFDVITYPPPATVDYKLLHCGWHRYDAMGGPPVEMHTEGLIHWGSGAGISAYSLTPLDDMRWGALGARANVVSRELQIVELMLFSQLGPDLMDYVTEQQLVKDYFTGRYPGGDQGGTRILSH